MRKFYFLYILLFLQLSLNAQLSKLYLVKFDPISGIFGEFRFSYERKISNYKYFYASAGYYYKDLKAGEKAPNPPSNFQLFMRDLIQSPQNKFFYASAGYFYKDYKFDREKLFGPTLRFGLKQYFKTKFAPEGPFMYLGLNYALLLAQFYNENYELAEKVYFHKPGASFSVGNQWLFGTKKNYLVCAFLGAEYYYYAQQPDKGRDHFWQHTPSFVLYMGVEVGFAFRQRNLHW